ncbi:hypothetical protein GQ56_0104540 [Burkholderia paludis]|uniref:alpha/beta fold hydrolase n=1 Tax=Burkholderia paludis TaxID=1506587 RepID=UPI0004DB757E|nr:alpha/beta hydrolase [Burkholderia paludis]KFG98327.1 hypothetical protein GQ56_0104540 [Burkholderia paludis]
MKEFRVANGDVDIAVRDTQGAGAPLLFLHGLGRSLLDWSKILPLLADDYRLIAMDLRSHGRSGAGAWTWPAVLDDVHAVLTRCAAEHATIVGHSLGGIVAARYAHEHPETAGVVNLDGFGKGRPEYYIGIDRDVVLERLQQLRAFEVALAGRTLSDAEANAMVQQALGAAARMGVAPELLEESLRRGMQDLGGGRVGFRPGEAAQREIQASLDETDVLGLYRSLSCPLLIVRGTRPNPVDRGIEWLPPLLAAYAEGLRQQLDAMAGQAGTRVEYVDATHAMIVEIPRDLAALIRQFSHDCARR